MGLKCKVTAIVRGKRETISIPMKKMNANKFAKNLRRDMISAIPQFKWAKNIRVEC